MTWRAVSGGLYHTGARNPELEATSEAAEALHELAFYGHHEAVAAAGGIEALVAVGLGRYCPPCRHAL
jgi:hypothetical protein